MRNSFAPQAFVGLVLTLAAGLRLVLEPRDSLATPPEITPGVDWPIKTSLPAGTQLGPGKSVKYADLVALIDPPGAVKNDPRYQATQIPAFPNALDVIEGDILTTTGRLHLVAGEPDGDYHIEISAIQNSQASCLIVEVPNLDPAFVAAADLRPHFDTIREFSNRTCSGAETRPRAARSCSVPVLWK
jgi:hypothetical protein